MSSSDDHYLHHLLFTQSQNGRYVVYLSKLAFAFSEGFPKFPDSLQ